MKPTKLNIKKKEDQFKTVPFVHNMTTYQLKVLVKRLWVSLQYLANILDKNRPDISNIIDLMLDGNNWNEKMVDDRYVLTRLDGQLIRFDTKTKQFAILDNNMDSIVTSQGKTINDVKREKAERRRR
jgi:hypothetical protein